jgi:hypothetical protein
MDSNSLHRLAKALIDSGESSSIDEALNAFGRYGVRIRLGYKVEHAVDQQIVALTVINCASRSFQGNVLIDGNDFELKVPGFAGQRLSAFSEWAGVNRFQPADSCSWPTISIGGGERTDARELAVWSSGWSFGIGTAPRASVGVFAPACVAAGGLAVSEAFSILRGDNPYAGCRNVRMSLWGPTADAPFPPAGVSDVPAQEALWLVGLGHLGQAYAWTLGFMTPGLRPLVLQDFDEVTQSSLSTSVLSHASDLGKSKARIVAKWLETRGFKTALVERRFDESQRVRPEEPSTALFGVDNAAARRVIEGAGFSLVVDAGLGSGYSDFRGLRIRTFPGPSSAARIWASESSESIKLAAPYQRLLQEGADACGVTMLATRAVGAPFVGCVAAAFVVAERVRRQLDGPNYGFLDLNLREPQLAEVG